MRFFAVRHNKAANKFEESGEIDRAVVRYKKATHSDPKWSVPWFNLGLLYKRQKKWPESFDYNMKAAQLNPMDEASWWNLGIAATALGRWEEARLAWTKCNIKISDGAGPIVMNLGLVPIRINPDGDAEVIWCDRIDPARAVVKCVPLPGSEHRYGDVLLHDGAANGYRKSGDQDIPVFDELELLQPSQFGTWEVLLENCTRDHAELLVDFFQERDCAAEDWSGSIRTLCKTCSEGKVDASHQHEMTTEPAPRRLGLAARDEDRLKSMMQEWIGTNPGMKLVSMKGVVSPLSTH
jgi:tetratricopeptide (TPR) repeat protein